MFDFYIGWLLFYAGSLLAIYILSFIIQKIFLRKLDLKKRKVYSVLLAYTIASILFPLGSADGGPINWFSGIIAYAPATLTFLAIYLDSFTLKGFKSVVVRFWNGELSLAISYWVVPIFATALALSAMALIESQGAESTRDVFFQSVSYLLIMIVVTLFCVVGITRSARYQIADPTKNHVWGYLAIVFVFFGIARVYYESLPVATSVARQYTAVFSNTNEQATITITQNGAECLYSGWINDDSIEALVLLLGWNTQVETIELDSIGGSIEAALTLAGAIDQFQLDTTSNTKCNSACTLAFLAGKNRGLGPDATLGFHMWQLEGGDAAANETIVKNVYRELGLISDVFLGRVVNTPFDEMWEPTRNELLANKILTSRAPSAQSSVKLMEKASLAVKAATVVPQVFEESGITLTSLQVDNNQILYLYTAPENVLDAFEESAGYEAQSQMLRAATCDAPAMETYLNRGFEFIYEYRKKIDDVINPPRSVSFPMSVCDSD